MEDRVRYENGDGLCQITVDDGKANAMSPGMQADLLAALEQARADDGVVILRGRPGVFSGGFDLGVLAGGGAAGAEMVLGGFALARRILAHPRPVLAACTGHAIAMGAFLLLSSDYRLAPRTSFRIAANEVAIGLTMPHAATALLRYRLTPSAFQAATLLALEYGPENAVDAGFLDELVEPDDFEEQLRARATALAGLDRAAQVATKARTRSAFLSDLEEATARDRAEFEALTAAT